MCFAHRGFNNDGVIYVLRVRYTHTVTHLEVYNLNSEHDKCVKYLKKSILNLVYSISSLEMSDPSVTLCPHTVVTQPVFGQVCARACSVSLSATFP